MDNQECCKSDPRRELVSDAAVEAEIKNLAEAVTELEHYVVAALRPIALQDTQSWREMLHRTTQYISGTLDEVLSMTRERRTGDCISAVVRLCEEFMLPPHLWAWNELMGAPPRKATLYAELCRDFCAATPEEMAAMEDDDDCYDEEDESGCCGQCDAPPARGEAVSDEDTIEPFQRLYGGYNTESDADDGPEVL